MVRILPASDRALCWSMTIALLVLVVAQPAWSEDPFLVRDIFDGPESSLLMWFEAGGAEVFFRANDGSHGNELWHSDGTLPGTGMVEDLYPGGDSSNPYAPVRLPAGVVFGAGAPTGLGLWKVDESTLATSIVLDELAIYSPGNPNILVKSGNRIFFVAKIIGDTTAGHELWVSDGTPAGTEMVEDIWPGGTGSYPEEITAFGDGRVVFSADDGALGCELWVSDGTVAGTEMVKDIWPGAPTSLPSELAMVGDEVYFSAGRDDTGHELWKSDGTEPGTLLVKDIWPGPQSGGAAEITALGDIALFKSMGDGTLGAELWRSDGTATGTYLVKDISPGVTPSYIQHLTEAGGRVFFVADDGTHGSELWKSDGTEAGTVMVKDIFTGASASDPDHLFAFRGALYFTADDGVHGHELWRSDGSEAGTLMVADINPGGTSTPTSYTVVNDLIFISAYHVDSGRELWAFESDVLFTCGFETGDTSEWTTAVP